MLKYIGTIHKQSNSDYGVQFYDFPGCITAGDRIEEAQIMANEALKGHISLMVTDHDTIPSPSSLETIISNLDHHDAIAKGTAQGAIAFIVINIPEESLKLNALTFG